MVNKLIELSLRYRGVVLTAYVLLGAWGYWAMRTGAVDAIPDLSDHQVIVFTDWAGHSAQEVEDQVTYPVVTNLQGLPGVRVVRSQSAFGFSMVYAIFEDDVELYFARTRVLEALGRLLRSNTRAMDASCRLDEHRFAVLLSGVGLATAHSRMEGLRRQCATQIVVVDGQELGFSVSMGVSSFPHTALNQEELLRASETALVEAKRRGGNHVTLASIRFEAG